ncbi:hypothetical protein PZ61_0235650 [Streptomyces sp. MNU77]|nr:hypothetical protein PZ61_0235650 [Streptomyces sp. MNU77]
MVRIGCGSAFDRDRIDWAERLAYSGLVDHLAFDCLAERSMALNQLRKLEDPGAGYMRRIENGTPGFDPRLPEITDRLAAFVRDGGTIVGNFGAANPTAAGECVVQHLRDAGATGVKVGVITGDDVLQQVLDRDLELPEQGCTVTALKDRVVSANAYIGAEPVVEALWEGARFVLGGRLADPSPYVGAICHANGWALDDWDRVAHATAAGHLLECGTSVTGGNYPDPPYNTVENMTDLSFPWAEVGDGHLVVSKIPGTGGVVNGRTVRLQLAYEVHDPGAYLTPDVTADYSRATVREVGPDRVAVAGITGRPRPDTLKVLVGLDFGWKVTSEISYGGPGCVERARLAAEICRARVARVDSDIVEWRADVVGVDALYGDSMERGYPAEVRMRVAARTTTKKAAQVVMDEADYLPISGPAAGGGRGAPTLTRAIGVTPAYLPRADVPIAVEVITV